MPDANGSSNMTPLFLTLAADAFVARPHNAANLPRSHAAAHLPRSIMQKRINGITCAVVELLSTSEYESALQSSGDQLVVVQFGMTWCKPCKSIEPEVAKLSDESPGSMFYQVLRALIESAPSGAFSSPTVHVFAGVWRSG